MRETVGSLRAYFIVVGILSGVQALLRLARPTDPLLLVMLLASMVLGAAFIVAGVQLRVWLRSRLPLLIQLIWATMSIAWLDTLYQAMVLRTVPLAIGVLLIRPFFVALIGFYLLRSVRRLASEASKST